MSALALLRLATAASVALVAAYLLAGGAQYKPLAVADPCQTRPQAVLAERGVFDGIVLSALDGAACELQVSREELVAALASERALDDFSARYELSEDEVDDAVRSGLLRAVADAERQGRIGGLVATVAHRLAENAPVAVALDLFRALPGDPSLPELLERARELGLGLDELGLPGPRDLGDLLGGLGA